MDTAHVAVYTTGYETVEDGWVQARLLELPGVITAAPTRAEAEECLLDALQEYLTSSMATMPLGAAKVNVIVCRRPSAAPLATEDLERMAETIAVLSDPATMRRLAESDAELARGEVVSAAELADAMRNSPPTSSNICFT